jgi:ribosomal subunit interface protein
MRVELTGRHVEIVPTLRRLVDLRLAKLERLLDHRAVSAQVVLTQEKRLVRADVTLHALGERFLHGMGEAPAWDAAIGRAADKIEQQAQKVKSKWERRKRDKSDVVSPEPKPTLPAAAATKAPRVPLRMPRVLRMTRQPVRSMSVADATRRLDSTAGAPVVFRDVETEALSVLYRNAEGDLVLVLADR